MATSYLTIKELTDEIGFTPKFWSRTIKRRELKIVRIGGRILVRRDDLEKFLRPHYGPWSQPKIGMVDPEIRKRVHRALRAAQKKDARLNTRNRKKGG